MFSQSFLNIGLLCKQKLIRDFNKLSKKNNATDLRLENVDEHVSFTVHILRCTNYEKPRFLLSFFLRECLSAENLLFITTFY